MKRKRNAQTTGKRSNEARAETLRRKAERKFARNNRRKY